MTQILDFIVEYWFLLIALLAAGFAAYYILVKFLGLPTGEQIVKIREWLVWAVTEAEDALGSETGEGKLRMVFTAFVAAFPLAAKILTYEQFKALVDEALAIAKELAKTDKAFVVFLDEPILDEPVGSE